MKKNLLTFSFVATVALFTGCGGGSGGSSDTTAPKFTNTTFSFSVDELTVKTVDLDAEDESTVKFIETKDDGDDATISGNKLTFTAPSYVEGGVENNTYKITVTAKDSAGNETPKIFTFIVRNVITDNIKADASYFAPIGGQTFSTEGSYIKDGSGLLWQDADSGEKTYDDAEAYCDAQGLRLPTRGEFLNLMDYTKGDNSENISLVYNNFTIYSSNSFDASWVEKVDNELRVVNHKSGADTNTSTNMDQRVLCVYGDKADAHTIVDGSTVKDNTTGLEWTKITSTSYDTHINAAGKCPAGFGLPTINQLRSIIVNNRISELVAPIADPVVGSGNYSIWSSTEVKNDANASTLGKAYYTIDINAKSGVTSDRESQTHHITCVK